MTFRLLSWNLHGIPFLRKRRERMMTALSAALERKPDIIALQEVWDNSDAEALAARADAEFIRVVRGRGQFGRPVGGLMVFVRESMWHVVRCEFRPYLIHAPAWRIWEADGISNKGVLHLHLLHRETRQELLILNTHLQSQYPEYGRLYESERAAQIAKLEKIAANAARAHAVIAAGDFNTAPNEALYNVLTKSWQDLTIDARAAAGKRAVTHLGDGSRVWLDYILVWKDPRFKYAEDVRLIRNAKIDDPFSDHHGLTAVISVESSAGMRLLEAAVSAATFTRREWIKSTTGYIRQR